MGGHCLRTQTFAFLQLIPHDSMLLICPMFPVILDDKGTFTLHLPIVYDSVLFNKTLFIPEGQLKKQMQMITRVEIVSLFIVCISPNHLTRVKFCDCMCFLSLSAFKYHFETGVGAM